MAVDNKNALVLKKVKFMVDSIVYIITDPKQRRCQVISIEMTPNGYLYHVKWGINDNYVFYDSELSDVRDEAFLAQSKLEGDYSEE
jgi:hypothetical protein